MTNYWTRYRANRLVDDGFCLRQGEESQLAVSRSLRRR